MQPLVVKCPNCLLDFELADALVNKVKEEMSSTYSTQIEKLRKELDEKQKQTESKEKQLQRKLEEIEYQKFNEIERVKIEYKMQLDKERILHEERLKKKVAEEERQKFEDLIMILRKSIADKESKINAFEDKERELLKVSIEKEELEKMLKHERENLETKLKFEQQNLEAKLNKEKENIENNLREKIKSESEEYFKLQMQQVLEKTKLENEQKIQQLEKQIEDQRKLADEMKRKQEQGSMQLQGETFEQVIKRDLLLNFNQDKLSDIKTGERGADLKLEIQRGDNTIGSILIECKNAQTFSKDWIAKLNNDKIAAKSDIGLLITVNMPNGYADEKLINIDGVWVCQYGNHVIAIRLIREMIHKLNNMSLVNTNIENKAVALYQYLSSDNFKSQFQRILNSYSMMKTTIDAERKAMEKHWKEREKQLEQIYKSAIDIHSELSTIASSNDNNTFMNFDNLLGEATETIRLL